MIVVNKWDLIEKETNTMKEYTKNLRKELVYLSYAPVLFISVLTGQRVNKIMDMVIGIESECSKRVPTGVLNTLISDAILMNQPPSDKGKKLKIYYATQVAVKPPLFSFKINDRELMHFSYARYLENKIREGFGFDGTSIKFVYRAKGEDANSID